MSFHTKKSKDDCTPSYLNHTKLATFRSIEFVHGARNRTLPYPIVLNNSGIQIHGKPIS
jgi:hypothetical protein